MLAHSRQSSNWNGVPKLIDLLPASQQKPGVRNRSRRSERAIEAKIPFVASLKRKWSGFWNTVYLSIAEEEMKLHREELEKQVRSSD